MPTKPNRREVIALMWGLFWAGQARADGERVLQLEVTFAQGGRVQTSGGQLKSDSPWMPYLAPGMWIRVWGEWEEGKIEAKRLEVIFPRLFSYYRGPANLLGLGQGWLEAWYAAEQADGSPRQMLTRPVEPSKEARLLVRREVSRWTALPPGIDLPGGEGAKGWVLVEGEVRGGAVRWNRLRPFP